MRTARVAGVVGGLIVCSCCRCSWWFDCLRSLSRINSNVVTDKLVTVLRIVLTTDPIPVGLLYHCISFALQVLYHGVRTVCNLDIDLNFV